MHFRCPAAGPAELKHANPNRQSALPALARELARVCFVCAR